MSALDDLANKVARLRDQLKDAEEKYRNALIEDSPYRVGQISKSRDGRRGKIANIKVDISPRGGTLRPILALYKKDGSLGSRTIDLWLREYEGWERDDV